MRRFGKGRGAVVVALVVAQIVGFAIYALAGPGRASFGGATAPVNGLEVEDVDYVLDSADPGHVERVTFRVDLLPADATIEIRLRPHGRWFSCAPVGGRVECETPNTTAESVTELSVVIAG